MIERTFPDAGDAVANRDVGQLIAVMKRIIPDAGDARGDHDAGQVVLRKERIIPDADDTVGDRVATSGFALRILDESGLALVE